MTHQHKIVQYGDNEIKHTIEFTRNELKRLYNALIIDEMSNDGESLLNHKILSKLKYYIEENGKD